MSSVLFTNINFPKSCAKSVGKSIHDFENECPFAKLLVFDNDVICPYLNNAKVNDPTNKRHPSCPLRYVPDDHGDLIDKDAAIKMLKRLSESQDPYQRGIATAIIRVLDEMPVIIESEEHK